MNEVILHHEIGLFEYIDFIEARQFDESDMQTVKHHYLHRTNMAGIVLQPKEKNFSWQYHFTLN